MANEDKRNGMESEEPKGEPEQGKKPEDQKTEEPKKGNPVVNFVKGCWTGIKKAGSAVNGFVHKHPYITAGLSTGIGYAVKIGVDLLSGSSEDVNQESQTLELPEGQDNFEPEDDSIEIELPEIETTTEE